LLDVESFEAMGPDSSGVSGFMLALADPWDVPFVKDQLTLISPGVANDLQESTLFQIFFYLCAKVLKI
jgi:hypothetical protein